MVRDQCFLDFFFFFPVNDEVTRFAITSDIVVHMRHGRFEEMPLTFSVPSWPVVPDLPWREAG